MGLVELIFGFGVQPVPDVITPDTWLNNVGGGLY